MSKDELIEKLKELHSGQHDEPDVEADHQEADELLLKYINDPFVKEAFDDIRKWYA